MKVRLGVLISGGGSNLQAILDTTKTPILDCAEVVTVISNKKEALGLQKAKQAHVSALLIELKNFSSRFDYYEEIIRVLKEKKVDLICLAGFLLRLEPNIIHQFQGCILNIHPSLLPRHGGIGMYGHHVHEAVIKSHDLESGCTVHVVDEELDHGPILMQRKIPVLPTDTPETLAARVLKEEHLLYPAAISEFIKNNFSSRI